MPQVFTAIEEVRLPAPGHGGGYEYRVAYGIERWGDRNAAIFKVQMVVNGRIYGRQAVSYPTVDELNAVIQELTRLRDKYGDKPIPMGGITHD